MLLLSVVVYIHLGFQYYYCYYYYCNIFISYLVQKRKVESPTLEERWTNLSYEPPPPPPLLPHVMSPSHDVKTTFHGQQRRGTAVSSTHDGERDVIVQLKDYSHSDADLVIPIWIPVLIMVSYVMLGAALFQALEGWENYMIGFYFCFVTLTTIGLGDYVPGNAFKSPTHMLILCIVYVFFGLALIAMCFDLVQHEVRMKFRSLGHRLGILEPKMKVLGSTPTLHEIGSRL